MSKRYQGWRARRILAEIKDKDNSANDDFRGAVWVDCDRNFVFQKYGSIQKSESDENSKSVNGTISSSMHTHLLELIGNNSKNCMISNCFLKKHVSLSDLTSDTQEQKAFNRTRSLSAPPSLHFHFAPVSKSLSVHSAVHFTNEDSDATYCESESEKDSSDDFGDMNEGRKRRHIRDENSWKKNKAKKLRMLGEEYVGYRKPKGCKATQDQVRLAKILGPPCTSSFCQKSKLRGCQRFEEETRKSIHDKFWKTMNWDQRRVYVAGLVTRSARSRHTKSALETSRREGTFSYYLPIESDVKVQVCKRMFLSTLSLCSTAVQSWVKQAEFAMVPNQNFRNSRASSNVDRKTITLRRKAGDSVVTDLRAMKYTPNGDILIKLDFDEDWRALPQRKCNINTPVVYSQLHESPLPISSTKYNHLQQLKDVLPKDCHPFYDALPHV
ncbi:unnamed protein product, partial [Brenthis ino]